MSFIKIEHTHTQTEHHRAMNMNNESWGVQSYMQPNCVETLQRDCDGTEKLWVVATYQFQFKAWKSTHERIMMIMISSPRTKSNSCAAVQVKSTSSVVTVSLVPSQCSDTHTHTKPMHLEDCQMLWMPSTSHSCLLLQLQPQSQLQLDYNHIRSSYQFFILHFILKYFEDTKAMDPTLTLMTSWFAYVRINA